MSSTISMTTDLTITGSPWVSFKFYDLPSWNTLAGMHYQKYGKITKALRQEGARMSNVFQRIWKERGQEFYIENKIMLICKIYPPSEAIMDIPNVSIKQVCDGFTDSKLWPDDEWSHLPICIFMWAGINTDETMVKVK